jgi:uncharacterized membrane protein
MGSWRSTRPDTTAPTVTVNLACPFWETAMHASLVVPLLAAAFAVFSLAAVRVYDFRRGQNHRRITER